MALNVKTLFLPECVLTNQLVMSTNVDHLYIQPVVWLHKNWRLADEQERAAEDHTGFNSSEVRNKTRLQLAQNHQK